jgi:NAD(P)-dependent dehydrogenase (short-subunit alcohol dehydrogenase family)
VTDAPPEPPSDVPAVERGAKVYAAARRPETIELSGVEPVQLDITDPTSVRRAADLAGDVTVLINNAGTSTRASLLSGTFEDVRLEMETHYFGTLSVIRAFAPIIATAEEQS